MSFHVLPKRRAEARRLAQQRRAAVSSVLVAILTVLLLLLILLQWILPAIVEGESDDEGVAVYSTTETKAKKPNEAVRAKAMRRIRQQPHAPASSVARIIAAETASSISIPKPDGASDLGGELRGGDGIGGGGGNVPRLFGGRCSESQRLKLLEKNGGTPACEAAVLRALRWLKKTQNKDGSWCDNNQVAMTGLALLSYLGHCETPQSEEFGDSVSRAIVYLVDIGMKNDGKLSEDLQDGTWCYDHAIATYALGEAVVLCKSQGILIPRLSEVVKLAGDWILDHQHDSGGWDYGYARTTSRGGDNSITLWQLQALKACQQTGLWPKGAFSSGVSKSLAYLAKAQQSGGGVGYMGMNTRDKKWMSMTGGAMLAYQMWDDPYHIVVVKGASYLSKAAKFKYNSSNADLYRHYYYMQALMNWEGGDWEKYNRQVRHGLLSYQNRDGTWKDVGRGHPVNAIAPKYQGRAAWSVHYRTCLCTLMLEVYYRYLTPLKQSE